MTDNHSESEEEKMVGIKVDPAKMQLLMNRIRDQQNLVGGIIAGLIAASIGAILWAVITVATEYQIGFMAVGVGLLVGISIRLIGKGIDTAYGIIGAVLSLLGCAVGNLLSACGMIAKYNDIPYFTVISVLELEAVKNLMVKTFSPIDLLFYGIAIYEGYKLSFRRLTADDLASLIPQDFKEDKEAV